MILMRFREMTSCAEHQHAIIVREDTSGQRTLAIATDPDESERLVRELSRGPDGEHPIYDFLDGVLRTFQVTLARVVLEYVAGAGIAGAVSFRHSGGEVVVPCYPADALALAQRTKVPIYVSPDVFADDGPPSDERGGVAQWLEGLTRKIFRRTPRAPGGSVADDAADRPARRGHLRGHPKELEGGETERYRESVGSAESHDHAAWDRTPLDFPGAHRIDNAQRLIAEAKAE